MSNDKRPRTVWLNQRLYFILELAARQDDSIIDVVVYFYPLHWSVNRQAMQIIMIFLLTYYLYGSNITIVRSKHMIL